MKDIPIAKTTFTEEDKRNILKPLESGWVVQGPYVEEFENKWNAFTGAQNSIAVSNCTNALVLSLAALGITSKDEVIVPSFTWVATANAVESVGATPVFCDISLDSFNIDVKLIEDKISANTKAIIPVHLFGLPAELDSIMKIAAKHDLLVIEDAACGFSSYYKGKHVGNFGHTGCFSFHPRKAITTGEGGMITTNNDETADKIKSMRNHGAHLSDYQRHNGSKPYELPDFPFLGFNFRMTDIQGALGSTQMDRAGQIAESRRKIAAKYDNALSDIEWLNTPRKFENVIHGYQAYVCMYKPDELAPDNIREIHKERNELMQFLFEHGISTRPGTHAVHNTSFYREKYGIKPEEYFNSLSAEMCSIALPLYDSMNDEEINYVVGKIREFEKDSNHGS